MVNDLKREDLLEDRREIAQDRGAWRCLVEVAVCDINEQAQENEEEKNERKKEERKFCHPSRHPGGVK